MIEGVVTEDFALVFPVTLRLGDEEMIFPVTLDTGFDDYPSLPRLIIETLNFTYLTEGEITLAGG